MKRGSIRVWLLSDLTAVIGIAWRVWPLMIMVIRTGRRAMLGEQISPRVNACIMHMLPIAEAHLPYAPCRPAWRALGWNVREVKLEHFPPITSWSDVTKGFAFYRAQMMDLRETSTRFTESLRDIYRIRTSIDANAVAAADGSTGTLRAAQHPPAGASTRQNTGARVALMASSERRERQSNHEGGLTCARGPPGFASNRNPIHAVPQRA